MALGGCGEMLRFKRKMYITADDSRGKDRQSHTLRSGQKQRPGEQSWHAKVKAWSNWGRERCSSPRPEVDGCRQGGAGLRSFAVLRLFQQWELYHGQQLPDGEIEL